MTDINRKCILCSGPMTALGVGVWRCEPCRETTFESKKMFAETGSEDAVDSAEH